MAAEKGNPVMLTYYAATRDENNPIVRTFQTKESMDEWINRDQTNRRPLTQAEKTRYRRNLTLLPYRKR